jgi:hypothetical protein
MCINMFMKEEKTKEGVGGDFGDNSCVFFLDGALVRCVRLCAFVFVLSLILVFFFFFIGVILLRTQYECWGKRERERVMMTVTVFPFE